MTSWPVFSRELRVQARRPFNYWLRLAVAVTISLILGLNLGTATRGSTNPAEIGSWAFALVHSCVFFFIWIFVPTLTADCLAREKREDTLGLMFLTPLSARAIVLGKSLVHFIRASTCVLLVVPFLAVAILFGGVTWLDVASAFAFEFCAIFLALAAGLMASAVSKHWGRAMLLAEIFSLVGAGLFALCVLIFFGWLGLPYFTQYDEIKSFSIQQCVVEPFLLVSGRYGVWSQYFSLVGIKSDVFWPELLTAVALFSFLGFMLAFSLAAFSIERTWQQRPLSIEQEKRRELFTAPRFLRGVFERRQRRLLEKNPVAWLEQRSWDLRASRWGWCAAVIVAEVATARAVPDGYWSAKDVTRLVLMVAIAGAACSAFKIDKETGLLEMLLVSPLPPRAIILGKLQAIWSEFLPAIVVVGGVALVVNFTFLQPPAWASLIFMTVTFVGLPVVGLYFALNRFNFIFRWLCALACWFALPLLAILTWDRGGQWREIAVALAVCGAAPWVIMPKKFPWIPNGFAAVAGIVVTAGVAVLIVKMFPKTVYWILLAGQLSMVMALFLGLEKRLTFRRFIA